MYYEYLSIVFWIVFMYDMRGIFGVLRESFVEGCD